MSNFKVSKEKISIFTHPSGDKLQLGRIGSYQVVVQKGLYQDGDLVVFAPEKSVLTGQLKSEYETYLAGPNKDRVKAIRLRDQISSGIIIPPHLISDFESPWSLRSFDRSLDADLAISCETSVEIRYHFIFCARPPPVKFANLEFRCRHPAKTKQQCAFRARPLHTQKWKCANGVRHPHKMLFKYIFAVSSETSNKKQ